MRSLIRDLKDRLHLRIEAFEIKKAQRPLSPAKNDFFFFDCVLISIFRKECS